MSFWKVLGGAAVGVVAVVALPIAGPIGAVTAVGALVAGGAGAAVGGVAEVLDDSEEEAEKRGEEKATAKYDKKYKKLRVAFEQAQEQMKESTDYFNLVIAMESVGMACAACDGEVSEEERQDINDFVSGIASGEFPENIKMQIDNIAKNPPNIKTAFEAANRLGLNSLELFDEIIEVVIHSDGYVHENEKEFQQAWNVLVAAA